MQTLAVIVDKPEHLRIGPLDLVPTHDEDVVVDVHWTGVSTGTERLLYSGKMPPFPGMGYPLVPGYEAVGEVVKAGSKSGRSAGETVFVPGARCYKDAHGLFGASAERLVVAGERVTPIQDYLGEDAALLALAATAYHALKSDGARMPELIVGHGVLGRLLVRLTVALGGDAPTVWELNEARAKGAEGYQVVHPEDDGHRAYNSIYDVSGDSAILDKLIGVLSRNGEIVLAGFYSAPLSFTFPPAFMREARMRIAAEWQAHDLEAVLALIDERKLSLSGLITHRGDVSSAPDAYRTAFEDDACLKMILDWGGKQ